jgi:hypothetical protein
MTYVMTHSKARLGDRLVILAIANHADAQGRAAWPSIATLAAETLMSERQVQRAIRRLEAEIGIGDLPGPHGVHRFVILGMGDKLSPGERQDVGGVVTGCHRGGDKSSTEPAQNVTQTLEVSKKGSEEADASSAKPRNLIKEIWARGKVVLGPEGASLIGQALKRHDKLIVIEAIIACETEAPADPVPFFIACLKERTNGRDKRSPVEKLYAGGLGAVESILARERGVAEADGVVDNSPTLTLLDGGRSGGEPEGADRRLVVGSS